VSNALSILQLLSHSKIDAGGAVQAFLLARGLAARGHRVTIAVNVRNQQCDKATRQRIEGVGCRYEAIDMRSAGGSKNLRRCLDGNRYDVIHMHREKAVAAFLRAVGSDFPELGAVANVGTSKPPNWRRARRLNSRRIDRIVVVAGALKKLLVNAARVDPTRIEVVQGAFDEQAFEDDVPPLDRRREFDIDGGTHVVGLIANIDAKKGHDVFLEAANRVLAQRGDCVFVMAGGGDGDSLLAMAAKLGIPADRIRYLGFRDDVARLVKSFDVSVSASTRGEGMTGAIRESLAMGTPVVCTAVAGNVEIVRHGDTGLLATAGDAASLADAILQILADPAAARRRAEKGKQLVRETLTSQRRAERMETVYRDVVTWRRVRLMPLERILFPPITTSQE